MSGVAVAGDGSIVIRGGFKHHVNVGPFELNGATDGYLARVTGGGEFVWAQTDPSFNVRRNLVVDSGEDVYMGPVTPMAWGGTSAEISPSAPV